MRNERFCFSSGGVSGFVGGSGRKPLYFAAVELRGCSAHVSKSRRINVKDHASAV